MFLTHVSNVTFALIWPGVIRPVSVFVRRTIVNICDFVNIII